MKLFWKWVGWGIMIVLLIYGFGIYHRMNGTSGLQPEIQIYWPTPVPTEVVKKEITSVVIENVAYTVQAPFGEWKDPRQQDGCEEAVALIAKCSVFSFQCPVEGEVIDKQWAKEQIIKMHEWQVERYGSGTDTSVQDTAQRLLGEYLGNKEYEIIKILRFEEIVYELMEGNLVIVPMNGRALKNPNFTGAGPDRHMTVVRGYDAEKNEIITNDPGFRAGRMYQYPAGVFWQAIRDYPSGKHEPITGEGKRGIVIKISRSVDQ